jgi:hypothetical protein
VPGSTYPVNEASAGVVSSAGISPTRTAFRAIQYRGGYSSHPRLSEVSTLIEIVLGSFRVLQATGLYLAARRSTLHLWRPTRWGSLRLPFGACTGFHPTFGSARVAMFPTVSNVYARAAAPSGKDSSGIVRAAVSVPLPRLLLEWNISSALSNGVASSAEQSSRRLVGVNGIEPSSPVTSAGCCCQPVAAPRVRVRNHTPIASVVLLSCCTFRFSSSPCCEVLLPVSQWCLLETQDSTCCTACQYV